MELTQFLQIMSWIILPVFLLAVVTTVFIHYRRKKKKGQVSTDPSEDIFYLSTEPTATANRNNYVLFDHTGLIRQYRNKLSYNHARYMALKHDFEKLELKYAAAFNAGNTRLSHLKNTPMENTTEQVQQAINKITEEFTVERNQLITRLDQLNNSYKNLESENESLLEQVNMQTTTGEEKAIIVNRWKEENNLLKAQVKEQEYLKDVIEEKKAQIEFLQNQVDQRIRNYHQAEQQRNQLNAELDNIRNKSGHDHELIAELKNQLEEKEELVISHAGRITYLENVVREIKEQNEILNAAVLDNQDKANSLLQELEEERFKTSSMEQKLLANKQLLQRLYKEFMSCVEESEETRVVVLKQAVSY